MTIKSIVEIKDPGKPLVLRCPYCWLGYIMPEGKELREKVAAKAEQHLRNHPEHVEDTA